MKNRNNFIDKEIQKNKKECKNKIKIFQNFDKNKGVKYTNFELNKIKFTITLDIKDISLLEIYII